ncbi:MAG: ABC transporter permease [Prevotella sp.]|nr:ABC transporter permease [Prevotella sp.]
MDMTIVSTLLGVLLLAFPLYAFYLSGARLVRQSVMALCRMLVQVSLTGCLVWALDVVNHWSLGVAALLLLSLFAAWMTARRGRLRRTKMLLPLWLCLFVASLATALYLETVVLRVEHPFDGRWLLAVGGAMLAAATSVLEVSLREYFVGLVRFSSTYYYKVGNGARWYQAVMPIVRRAVERSYRPSLARVSMLGLFVMPFLMSGLLMGGVHVLQAAAATIAIVAGGAFCSMLAFVLVVFVSHRFVIDKRGSLKDCVRLKPGKNTNNKE